MGEHATGDRVLVGGMWLIVFVYCIYLLLGRVVLVIWRKLDIEVGSTYNRRFGKHRELSNRIE